jgi:hypothetical protein
VSSNKFPAFGKTKNPLNKNVKTSPSTFKKKSVMFDEGKGISWFKEVILYDYFELTDSGYFTIENNQRYYEEDLLVGHVWDVNYLK